jgi:hypothetical protein
VSGRLVLIAAGIWVLVLVGVLAFLSWAERRGGEFDETSERELRRILDEDWERSVRRLLDEEGN